MRKIYPLPFNKFAIFVLCGLLSIAVITLAQTKTVPADPLANNCELKELNPPSGKQVTIGYVQLNQLDPGKIPWDSYDYINVIAYPPKNGVWNELHPPDDLPKTLNVLNVLKAKKPPTAKTQILLSIRNYDLTDWPKDDDKNYGKIIPDTITTIKTFGLDGVDIEYPGMRGSLCPDPDPNPNPNPKGSDLLWSNERDAGFVNFVVNLRNQMNQNQLDKKIIMLTVGRNVILGAAGLYSSIDFLNIETYHFSLYENLRKFNPQDPSVMSRSNAPLNEFTYAHDEWVGAGEDKIIMGVDFGNTFQVIFNNPSFAQPTLEVSFYYPNQNQIDFFKQEPELANIPSIQLINNLCPGDILLNDRLHLFSFPWKDLLKISKCKIPIGNWKYNFDDKSSTPWLYKMSESVPGAYYYISFEDFDSLNSKLNYVVDKSMRGVSISDISYDVVGSDSLLGYIQKIRSATPSQSTPNSSPNPTPKGKGGGNPTSTDGLPLDGNNFKSSPKTGAIIGGVFGSLIGLVILGACGFYFYRYRGRPKSASFRSLLKFKGFPNSGNHVISRNPEMTTEPTPNLFAPPTTVIPVASGYVTAMFDFTGKEENDLSFKKGDKIEVLERGDGPNDWWVGRVNGAVGEFPGNYVKET